MSITCQCCSTLYIQPTAGDAGGAFGAACVVWQIITRERTRFVMDHAYWGPAFATKQIAGEIDDHRDALLQRGCSVARVDDEDELCRRIAREIADGNVVGWFHGRMEWGRGRSETARSSATRGAPT